MSGEVQSITSFSLLWGGRSVLFGVPVVRLLVLPSSTLPTSAVLRLCPFSFVSLFELSLSLSCSVSLG